MYANVLAKLFKIYINWEVSMVISKEDLETKARKDKKSFIGKITDLQKKIKEETVKENFPTKFHGSTVGDAMPAD